MASIIDKGVNTGDIHHIYKVGGIMIVAAFLGLLAGMAGGRYGAKASTGFAKNLRNAMFDRIQTYSFANIDHFSTAGLVTRLTTDVTNVQNAYQMILRITVRAPLMLICSMAMCFFINLKLSSIFLVAMVVLAIALILIMSKVTYDDESTGKYGMCDGDGTCNQCKAGKYLSCGSLDSWNYFVFLLSVMQLHIFNRHFRNMTH